MANHSYSVGLACIKSAQSKWGNAWKMLSPELQRAAICEEVVHVLLRQREDGGQSALSHAQAAARAALSNKK